MILPSKIASANYSLNEQVIGKWINGKTLYRKVVNLPAFTASGGMWKTSANHGISSISQLIHASGFMYRSDGNWFPLPYATPYTSADVQITVSSTQVALDAGTDRTNCSKMIVVLEYTKN